MNNTVTEKIERNESIADNSVLKLKDSAKETADLTNNNHTPVLAIGKQDVEENKLQVPLKENPDLLLAAFNTTFDKSVGLSEETVSGVLAAYKKRIELYKNFNAKLIDSIKETIGTTMHPADLEKVLKLVKDNFEVSLNVMNRGMKSIIETFNKHISLTLNVNQKFSDNIITQFQLFKNMQQNSVSFYSNLTKQWWKEHDMK